MSASRFCQDRPTGDVRPFEGTLSRLGWPEGSRFLLAANYYTGYEHSIPGTTSSGETEFEKKHNFFVISCRYEHYLKVFKPFILGLSVDGVYSNKPVLNNYVSSLLLATPYSPTSLMKSMFLENYRAYSYGAAGLKTIFKLFKSFDLRVEGYVFLPYEKISLSDNRAGVALSQPFSYYYFAGTAELVYQSPVCPISISMNYFDQDGNQFLFLFNIGYLIFNQSRFYR